MLKFKINLYLELKYLCERNLYKKNVCVFIIIVFFLFKETNTLTVIKLNYVLLFVKKKKL